jgi:hypothetical protein
MLGAVWTSGSRAGKSCGPLSAFAGRLHECDACRTHRTTDAKNISAAGMLMRVHRIDAEIRAVSPIAMTIDDHSAVSGDVPLTGDPVAPR